MRSRTAGLLLVFAAALGAMPGHAIESPCELESGLCAPADADASCTAVGFFADGLADVARATTSIKDPASDERDYQNPHATEFGFRTPAMPSQVPPQLRGDLSVHLGAVESWCHSYSYEGNRYAKSCGGAKVDEAIFTINRGMAPTPIRLIVEGLTTSVCRAAEPGLLGPVYDMRVARVIIEAGSAYPINVDSQQGSILPVGSPGIYLAMNERFSSGAVSGCATAGSTAFRLIVGGAQYILGGASIKTCQL